MASPEKEITINEIKAIMENLEAKQETTTSQIATLADMINKQTELIGLQNSVINVLIQYCVHKEEEKQHLMSMLQAQL